MQATEYLFQSGGVEAFFVLEVVVKQCLVDAGAARDLISPCTGNAFMRKLFQGRFQDGRTGLLRLTA